MDILLIFLMKFTYLPYNIKFICSNFHHILHMVYSTLDVAVINHIKGIWQETVGELTRGERRIIAKKNFLRSVEFGNNIKQSGVWLHFVNVVLSHSMKRQFLNLCSPILSHFLAHTSRFLKEG